jgi:hypothetical protein
LLMEEMQNAQSVFVGDFEEKIAKQLHSRHK